MAVYELLQCRFGVLHGTCEKVKVELAGVGGLEYFRDAGVLEEEVQMSKSRRFDFKSKMVHKKAERKVSGLRTLGSVVGVGLLGAAVVQELRKPAGERAWHGMLWGRVPYELRPPTFARIRSAYWAPDDAHVFTGTPFGVGWTFNFGRLFHACSSMCTRANASTAA